MKSLLVDVHNITQVIDVSCVPTPCSTSSITQHDSRLKWKVQQSGQTSRNGGQPRVEQDYVTKIELQYAAFRPSAEYSPNKCVFANIVHRVVR